jgi:opacity protein-like surface antigen
MENNYMDNLVRDALSEYEMNVPASDWNEMEGRLDRSDSMRRKLYLTKGIEVCLMVFAIWTAVQWVQTDISGVDISADKSIEQQVQQPEESMIMPVFSTEKEAASEQEKNITSPEEGIENPSSYQGVPFAKIEKSESILKIVKAKLEETPTILNNQSNDLPIESELYINKSSVVDKSEIEKLANNNAKVFAVNNWSFIPSIKTELLEVDLKDLKSLELSIKPESILGEEKESGVKKDRKFRLGIIASMDWFNIRTPDVVAVTKEASALNISGGLSFDMKLGDKFRLESGVQVSKRTHTEKSLLSFSTNAQAFADERVDLKTTSIEIPLNAKYEVAGGNKTSVYALAGISNHFVMTIQNTLFEKSVSTQNYDLTIQTAGRGSVSESGLADQGELSSNYFISLNGGMGIEHQLNDRLSIFAQASYKHGFGSVGRHDDQISSVSVATGMRGSL